MLDRNGCTKAEERANISVKNLTNLLRLSRLILQLRRKRWWFVHGKICKNIRAFSIIETISIRSHMLMNGFVEDYMTWTSHGEPMLP
jgi:hypothetical protein